MDDNIIPINRKESVKKRISEALQRYEKTPDQWIDVMLELAAALAEGRALFNDNIAFRHWLVDNDLDHLGHQDRAALIHIADYPEHARNVAMELKSFSVQVIWREIQTRLTNVSNTPAEPTSIPEPPKIVALAAPEPESASKIPAIPEPVPSTAVVSEPAADAPEAFAIPAKSKLRDLVGAETADVLHAKFKSSKRMFTEAIGSANVSNNHKVILRYLANRCQEPDYPVELLLAQTWTPQLVYPHLPKRLVAMLPTNIATLYLKHSVLVETERRFMQTPEFGRTDPPLAAYNAAYAIFTALTNARKGNTVDPAAIHRPTFGDDEGKPPVVVRGTKLWPAETGTGYRYDDLRCACGLADSVLSAFDEQRPTVSSKTLKLRHIRSWLAGGFNSTGATPDGTLKAFNAVIQAWSWNVSEEMRNPLPSMIKNDGDAR